MIRISVTGEGEQSLRPEEAVAHLVVGFEGTARASVLRDTQIAHARVSTDAASFVDDGAARDWTAQSVHVGPYPVYRDGQEVPETRYRAHARIAITFVDIDALSAWVSDIGDVSGVTVGHLAWQLTDETEQRLRRRARELAVEDAISRAAVYARASGRAGVPALVGVYEPGLRPGGSGPGDGGVAGAPMMARGSGGEAPGLQFSPEDIVVRARVTADFDAS